MLVIRIIAPHPEEILPTIIFSIYEKVGICIVMVRHRPTICFHVMVSISHRNMFKLPLKRLPSSLLSLLKKQLCFGNYLKCPPYLLEVINLHHSIFSQLCLLLSYTNLWHYYAVLSLLYLLTAASSVFQVAMLKRCNSCLGAFSLFTHTHIVLLCFVKTNPLVTPLQCSF